MKSARLQLPAGQNWNCHGCSDCCRGHLLVTVSAEEKQRIERQNWTMADGVNPAEMIVSGLSQSRLGHQADGACVFLDAAGRCRIHAKFGEAAKPLACRLYPLVIYPAGEKIMMGLRFSCPSAAANKGRPMAELAGEAVKFAEEVLPEGCENLPPPPVAVTPGTAWPDFLRFAEWLDFTLAANDASTGLKLLRALHWVDAIERGRLDLIANDGADEIIKALFQSAVRKVPELPENLGKPSRFGQLFLRLLVLEHAQTPTVADRDVRSAYRWKMLAAAVRFLSSAGSTPALREGLKRVKFADIEKSSGPLPPGAETLLTRYFRVKIQSLQFCGTAFHGRPLMEGFRNLALLYPVIVWLARWLAVSAGREVVTEADVFKAVTLVDYQYSYAPYLSWRTRLLQQRNDIAKLVGWYAR